MKQERLFDTGLLCYGCKKIKPFSEFFHCSHNKYGYLEKCKDCFRVYRKKYEPEPTETGSRVRPTIDGKFQCSSCEKWLDPDNFYVNQHTKNERTSLCILCMRTKNKERYKKKFDRTTHGYCTKCTEIKPLNQFYQRDNKRGRSLRCILCSGEIRHITYDNITHSKECINRYTKHLSQSKTRGIVFGLSITEFENMTSKPCHYCGGFTIDKQYTGIDRVDSSIGYEITNCVPCCRICNTMKNSLSIKDFFLHIMKVAKTISNYLSDPNCQKIS